MLDGPSVFELVCLFVVIVDADTRLTRSVLKVVLLVHKLRSLC